VHSERPRGTPSEGRGDFQLVIPIDRSKTNQRGDVDELVVLPRGTVARRCPVTTVQTWLDAADISDGPLFRAVSKGDRPLDRRLVDRVVNDVVQAAVTRAGLVEPGDDGGYSAHSLRAGFVTYANDAAPPMAAVSDHAPVTLDACKGDKPIQRGVPIGATIVVSPSLTR
jgi:hypothetical protein